MVLLFQEPEPRECLLNNGIVFTVRRFKDIDSKPHRDWANSGRLTKKIADIEVQLIAQPHRNNVLSCLANNQYVYYCHDGPNTEPYSKQRMLFEFSGYSYQGWQKKIRELYADILVKPNGKFNLYEVTIPNHPMRMRERQDKFMAQDGFFWNGHHWVKKV